MKKQKGCKEKERESENLEKDAKQTYLSGK